MISHTIDRYAIFESIYFGSTSTAVEKLRDALIVLYTVLLKYLVKAKQFFQENTALRVIKSGLTTKRDIDYLTAEIQPAQDCVNQYASIVDSEISRRMEASVSTLGQEQATNYQKLKKLLEEIDGPIQRMSNQLRHFEDHLKSTERMEVLKWMSSLPYTAYHNQNKKDVLEGTGQWLLSDPVFREWKNDSASSLLWVHGRSGTGKTKLVSIVIEDSLSQHQAGNGTRPAYFYCSQNKQEPMRSDPQAILANIARQLSCLDTGSPILPPSVFLYGQRVNEGFASGGLSIDESVELIVKLTNFHSVTTIILDALDECSSETRYLLLEALQEILNQSQGLVKLFVSSREEGDLVCELRDYPSLKISSYRNSKDIKAFVETEVEMLVAKRRILRNSNARNEIKALIIKRLLEKADGV